MPSDSRRLSILSAREIDDLYCLPRFNEDDQAFYFDLSAAEKAVIDNVHTASAAAHLIMQCGYFKAKRRFFTYAQKDVQNDFNYILRQYFPRMNAGNGIEMRLLRIRKERLRAGVQLSVSQERKMPMQVVANRCSESHERHVDKD